MSISGSEIRGQERSAIRLAIMPNTVDSTEYDLFDYDTESKLQLEDAVKAAREAAKANPDILYRVVPVDPEMTGFRIEPVHQNQLYAELISRVFKHWAHYFSR